MTSTSPFRANPTPLRAIARGALVGLGLGFLGGCADPAPAYYQAFGFQCAQKKSGVSDVLCNKSHDPGAAKVSRYCYKTLADTNCFDRPDTDRKNQPQGSPG